MTTNDPHNAEEPLSILKYSLPVTPSITAYLSNPSENIIRNGSRLSVISELGRIDPNGQWSRYPLDLLVEREEICCRESGEGRGIEKSDVRSTEVCGDRFNSCQVIYSQFGLAIHQNDHQARRRFVEWAQNEIAVVPSFHKRILFSDEVHFWFNGYVNKQNCRIWSETNPQVYVETPLHPEKLTVWCTLWACVIIGPYFFKNDEGHNVTVNGDRYRAKITNFFIPELNIQDVQELWFQQDGATCHTARATIDLLKDTLGDRLISRFGPVNWPPRSCALTPLDYFL
ncbi:putative DD41D transposase [Trichonephila clavipes]|uniref:Putative DD41D transposase n=1 Tax=Trichonephila clavipes TaxID=2585209 RepID=A0A8X6RNP2_TRICX|nr:putative DD41D transposase [Trichonephila clavipes]